MNIVVAATERLERMAALDRVLKPVRSAVTRLLSPRWLRDALHGVWLGHPLHPVLTDVPIGSWLAASMLDTLPATGPASSALITTGVVAAVPTAAAGLTDWSDLHPEQQRVGFVHAAGNIAALGCYAASLEARRRGNYAGGKRLALVGLGAVAVGGYLGGHLSYRQAAGANHAEDVPHLFPSGWQSVAPLDDLPDGLSGHQVADVDLVVYRSGTAVQVLADKCAHLSGPLAEGRLVRVDGAQCVECPWHGSTFRLDDGAVVHGPATSPQPSFHTRVVDGVLEVSLPGAG